MTAEGQGRGMTDEATAKRKPRQRAVNALPTDAFANPQLSLFQGFLVNQNDERDALSNAVDLWDSIPRYAIPRKKEEELRLPGRLPAGAYRGFPVPRQDLHRADPTGAARREGQGRAADRRHHRALPERARGTDRARAAQAGDRAVRGFLRQARLPQRRCLHALPAAPGTGQPRARHDLRGSGRRAGGHALRLPGCDRRGL